VVLHLVRGSAFGEYLATTFELMNSVHRPLVSAVTHEELRIIAARRACEAEKLGALENALDNLVTIDINSEAVLSAYGEVQQTSRRAPGGSRELKHNDAWIAACAKAADATLLIADRDFSHLKAPDWPVQFCDPAPFMKPSNAGKDG
jgi:predicted nucleic acid-binding protein